MHRFRTMAWIVLLPLMVACSAPQSAPVEEPTPEPPAEPLACEVDSMLRDVRSHLSAFEHTTAFMRTTENDVLMLWLVDPGLTESADEAEIEEQANALTEKIAWALIELSHDVPCVTDVASMANIWVVDSQYRAWYYTVLDDMDVLPRTVPDQISEEQAQFVMQALSTSDLAYLRRTALPEGDPAAAPEGQCNWQEAEAGLWSRLSEDRVPVGFIYTITEYADQLMVLWDGSSDEAEVAATMADLALEANCLTPPLGVLLGVVLDDDYNVTTMAILDGDVLLSEDRDALIEAVVFTSYTGP